MFLSHFSKISFWKGTFSTVSTVWLSGSGGTGESPQQLLHISCKPMLFSSGEAAVRWSRCWAVLKELQESPPKQRPIYSLFRQPLNCRHSILEYTEIEAIITTDIFKKTEVLFMSRKHHLGYLDFWRNACFAYSLWAIIYFGRTTWNRNKGTMIY